MIPELEKLAEKLEEAAHLVVWPGGGGFEVVAIVGEGYQDAFPLPMSLQAAAADLGMILDTTTAARLPIEQMPEDFWESLHEVEYGGLLRVSLLGRPGQKYLQVFRAVSRGEEEDQVELEKMALSESELLQVVKWMREQSLFDHKQGDAMMEVLDQLS